MQPGAGSSGADAQVTVLVDAHSFNIVGDKGQVVGIVGTQRFYSVHIITTLQPGAARSIRYILVDDEPVGAIAHYTHYLIGFVEAPVGAAIYCLAAGS